MAWKNKSEIKICIAVLGPEGAGKHTVIEQIKNRILSQPLINHFDKEANRPSLKESELQNKLDFKLYSDFNHFSLGHPEHYGLIVLSFPQVSDFSKSDALAQYFHFFESLHKLTWLGVDEYVVAITRMDWIHTDTSKWFEQVSSWIKQRFGKIFGLKINNCIPLALEHNSSYDNLVGLNANGVLTWYKGPSLMQALTDLIDTCQRPNTDLWVIGGIENDNQQQTHRWITTDRARGEIIKDEQVRVYPPAINGIISKKKQTIAFDTNYCASTNTGNAESHNQLIMVPSNSTANIHMVLDLHAVLNSGLSHDELNRENRSYRFTFFGPQIIEGEIDRCTPLKIADVFSEKDLCVSLELANIDKINQHLGKEVLLRVYCRNFGAVTDLWDHDKDAGRVLIWDGRSERNITLAGVGRVIGFPDTEIQDCVEKLIVFDQIRVRENPQASIMIYKLEKIYHDLKRFMENDANALDVNDFQLRIKSLEEDFDQILIRTHQIEKEIRDNKLPTELFNLHVHLGRTKKILLKHLEDLADLIKREVSLEVINQRLKLQGKEYFRNVEFIRKHTIIPIRKCIAEAERKLTNEMKPKVTVHSTIPMDFSYYPVKPAVLDNIHDALCQLFDNSRRHAGRNDDLRVEVFIDPPTAEKFDVVRVQYQDNGLLTREVLNKIKSSQRGISIIKGKLASDGAELKESPQLGLGTSFNLNVSVWSQRFNKLDDIAIEIMEIVNAIDLDNLNSKNEFKDYLGTLEMILSDWTSHRSLEYLSTFLSDIAKSAPEQDRWLKRCHQQLLSSKQPESRNELSQIYKYAHHLRLDPVVSAIGESISDVNLFFGQQRIRINNHLKRIPQHRVNSFRKNQLFQQALFWGLGSQILPKVPIDQEATVSIDLQRSQNCKKHQIICTVYFPEFDGQNEILIAVRTRLYHLGMNSIVESGKLNKLVIFVPVSIPNAEGILT